MENFPIYGVLVQVATYLDLHTKWYTHNQGLRVDTGIELHLCLSVGNHLLELLPSHGLLLEGEELLVTMDTVK